ncbi:MAG: hypothetical protein CSA22_03060 [Deltaproteobacteria bacterium]|nr:MAG: hypothetical protein CSA22_03060 [Deltaproteobacteria bacterium]
MITFREDWRSHLWQGRYLLKFFWAPILDKNSYRKNHYNSWIRATGISFATCFFSVLIFLEEPANKKEKLKSSGSLRAGIRGFSLRIGMGQIAGSSDL